MPIQTYRDKKTGKIYTATGEHIPTLEEYQRRVASGELSGQPKDISEMPSVMRTPDGNIAYKTQMSSLLDGLQNKTALYNAAKEIIRRKQEIMQPISEAKAYWRTIAGAASTTPFGSKVEQGMLGGFKDKDFRLLSPSEQAQIRAARYGAAQAHLKGLAEEETYRGAREEDALQALADVLAEKSKLAQDEVDKAKDALNIIQKKIDLGIPVSQKDWTRAGVVGINNRVGGSLTWRHNNPLALKYSDWEKEFGATPGQKAKDGGIFAAFKTFEDGWNAAKALLRSKAYSNLSVDEAMKKWSNNGYGIEVWGDSPFAQSTLMKNLTDEQLDDLMKHMMTREGWREGEVVGQTKKRTAWTDAAVRSLFQKISAIPGNQYTINDLLNMSDDELAQLSQQYSQDLAVQAYKKLDRLQLLQNHIQPDEAIAILNAIYHGADKEYIKQLVKKLNPPMPDGEKKVEAIFEMLNKKDDPLTEMLNYIQEKTNE